MGKQKALYRHCARDMQAICPKWLQQIVSLEIECVLDYRLTYLHEIDILYLELKANRTMEKCKKMDEEARRDPVGLRGFEAC